MRDPLRSRASRARHGPRGVRVANPAFDVTPHALVTAIITEKGVVKRPYRAGLAASWRRRCARTFRHGPRAASSHAAL